MKFILWTLVWFGLCIIGRFLLIEQMGGWNVYIAEYSREGRLWATGMEWILWIALYFAIVRREKE